MKIKQIHIENFRSIKNTTINLHELTAVVGENNSGKTAILRALNCFFNFESEEKEFKDLIHRYSPRTKTKITVTFSEIPNKKEYTKYQNAYGNLQIRFIYDYSKFNRRLFYINDGETRPLDVSFLVVLKRDIDYAYIPASRSYKDIEWTEDSVFSRLVKRYLEDHTKNRDRLSSETKAAGNKFHDQILTKLSHSLTDLYFYDDLGEYQINYKENIDYKVFLDKLGLEILSPDKKDLRPVSEYGSGIQSLTVITLYRFLAKINDVTIVLGIEEPETNLHPQAQRKLIHSFKNSRQSCEAQAIFATHSTVIVDALDHDDIVLVRRVKDEKRSFHSEARQISEAFWMDHNITNLKHYNFFRFRNSDFFFAKHVIIVEGIVDAQVIEHILTRGDENSLFNVSIIQLGSISSFKYPYFLLNDLGIPFTAVVDKDFFTPYKNGNLESSRNQENSLPEYSGTLNKNSVLNTIFDTQIIKDELLTKLNKSYSEFFEYTKLYNLLPMQYCLEMDLVANNKSRELYYDHFGLSGNDRQYRSLLINRKDKIKDPSHLMAVVEKLQPKEYPISFKKIRKSLLEIIDNL